MRAEDVLDFTLVAGDSAGGNYRLAAPAATRSLDGSPAQHPYHQWYYYPEMTKDEMLVFTVFDSDRAAASPNFETMPAPSCFHSAFMDPSTVSQEVPSRESIDVRCLLIWDSDIENINTVNRQAEAPESSLKRSTDYEPIMSSCLRGVNDEDPWRKTPYLGHRSAPYRVCGLWENSVAERLPEVAVM
jgi:acetyl esterase/lipase